MGYLEERNSLRFRDAVFKKAWEEGELKYQLARNVIQYRKQMNWTQSQLAKKIGIKQSVIVEVENGSSDTTVGELEKIAETLGMDIYGLMGARPDPFSAVPPPDEP